MRMNLATAALQLLVLVAATGEGVIVSAADQPSERDILLEFFNALGGTSWKENQGWAENADDVCSWYGITCQGEYSDAGRDNGRLLSTEQQQDDEQKENEELDRSLEGAQIPVLDSGAVIELKLAGNNLIGRVPPSLWQLPNLRILHLSENPVDVAFTGASETLIEVKMHATQSTSITGISKFPNLLSLHMSATPLGDVQFPVEIFHLKKLQKLHMAECQLEGSFPERLYELQDLLELNLYNNEFTGILPDSLSYLTKLKELTLSKNRLKGRLPEWLGQLTNLQGLYLEENQFTGQLLPLENLDRLLDLYLDNNQLTGNIPANFLASVTAPSDPSTTIRVNLDNNHLGDVIQDALDNLEDLPLKLTLAGNLFTSFESNALCDNVKWMDGLVSTFSCSAILCPVGTSATLGRHTETAPCDTCSSGKLMGQMTCMDQDDEKTLRIFYQEMDGNHWKRKDGWMQDGTSYCDWYGVTCFEDTGADAANAGRVKRLELPNNGLIGIIPDVLFALSAVTSIDVSFNKISFPLSNLQLTPSLHVLNIGHTDTTTFDGIDDAGSFFRYFLADHLDIDGTIPRQLYLNPNLEVLSMANCRLTGTIGTEIGLLSNLRELYLWGNDLKGSIPSQITTLSSLRILSLADNQLTGTLPTGLGSMPALKAFTVKDQITKGGGLSGNILPFQYNTVLTNLYLSDNKFEGTIPTSFLNSVQSDSSIIVDMSNNQLTGTVPASLYKFDQMDFFVTNNFITKVDDALCTKRDWMYGAVGEYGCDAILCPDFTTSPLGRQAFDSIDCKDCKNPTIVDPIMGQTSCEARAQVLTERQILEIFYKECDGREWVHQDNWMSTADFCDWYGVSCDDAKSVVTIVLGANNMKGTVPSQLWSLPNLKRLSIFANQVNFSFEGIENAVNLRSLVLDDTKVTSLEGVGNAIGLEELTVRANEIKGTLPSEMTNLNNLQQLILSENQFTGTLPPWLNRLNKLHTLMLGDNRFSGSLLPFDVYPDLSLLSIPNCRLSGSIPDTFLRAAPIDAKLFVDVSNNQLVGTVPAILANHNLLSIHVADNKLTELSTKLCSMAAWNDFNVQSYGCNGIACAVGTYNAHGRQNNAELPCQECKKAKYLGSTTCGGRRSSSAIAGGMFGLLLAAATTTVLMVFGW